MNLSITHHPARSRTFPITISGVPLITTGTPKERATALRTLADKIEQLEGKTRTVTSPERWTVELLDEYESDVTIVDEPTQAEAITKLEAFIHHANETLTLLVGMDGPRSFTTGRTPTEQQAWVNSQDAK